MLLRLQQMSRKRTKRVLPLTALPIMLAFTLAATLIVAATHLTARNAARMMREHGWRSALFVSQYFHVPRVRPALKRSGVTPVFSAHARYFERRDVYSIAREVVGYGSYLLRADY